MQFWITFIPGTGGDGVANLLEKSPQIKTLDNIKDTWRIHHYVDNQPKFWAPGIDNLVCFRNGMPFCLDNNSLIHRYVELIEENHNTVVTSHDLNFKLLDQSDCKDILTKNRLNVLLLPTDYKKSADTWAKKNLRQISNVMIKAPTIDYSLYDIVVTYNEIISSYKHFCYFTKQLKLVVNEKYYEQYCQLTNGETSLATTGTPIYTSEEYIDGGIKYTQVGVVK